MYRLSDKTSLFLKKILGDNPDNITYLDQSDPEALDKTIRFLHDNESALERIDSFEDMMDFCFSHEQWTKFRDKKLNDITPGNILEEYVISPTVIDTNEPFGKTVDRQREREVMEFMENKSSKEQHTTKNTLEEHGISQTVLNDDDSHLKEEDLINERLNQKYERFKKENDMNEEYMNGNIGKEFHRLDCRNPYAAHKSFEELSGNKTPDGPSEEKHNPKDLMKEACDTLKTHLNKRLTDPDVNTANNDSELKAGSGYQSGGINTSDYTENVDLSEKECRDMSEVSELISKLADKHNCDHVIFTKDPSAFETDMKEMQELKDKLDGKYEMVNHPQHYNSSSIETIEKMVRIWGPEQTATWCEMTAFKYRERIGNKPDNSLEQEMGKIRWYESKARELRS